VGGGGGGDGGNGTNNGSFLLQLMPGVNFVRLNAQFTSEGAPGLSMDPGSGYNDDPANFATFVNNLTSQGIVVEIEDHVTDNTIPVGNSYAAELQWYKDVASYYKNNPYVWFGTMNEPWGNPTAQVLQQQLDIYNAIRSTGNNAPILLEISNPPNAWTTDWNNQGSYFSSMTTVVWDVHIYDLPGNSQSDVNNAMASAISAIRSTNDLSADGPLPIIVGEYGTSGNGTSVDATGTETVIAVQQSEVGSVAWTWAAGSSDRLQVSGVLTDFGNEVDTFLGTGIVPASWVDNDGS
jgi:hypothetical protein